MISLERIRRAHERVGPYIRRTPLLPLDDRAHLKLECFQPTGSFKVRGFFAAALAQPPDRLARGLLTISAGNAALAAAYVAHRLGVPCRTVMFDTAPRLKVTGVEKWGGQPMLWSRERALAWYASRGWEGEPEAFIHPFADEELMAGHGGLGLELLEDAPDLRRVVVPVGGGGLAVGVASAVKALRAEVEVVGVQSDGYPLWPEAFAKGGPVQLRPATIADGTTAPFDQAMFERLRQTVNRWVVVPEARVRAAVGELAVLAKVVAEGTGALAYAALDQLPAEPATVAVVSGGNISPDLLRSLLPADQ